VASSAVVALEATEGVEFMGGSMIDDRESTYG